MKTHTEFCGHLLKCFFTLYCDFVFIFYKNPEWFTVLVQAHRVVPGAVKVVLFIITQL